MAYLLHDAAAGAGVTCPYSVEVTVVEARGLKRSDIFTADPFAWLRLGGSSHKTKVCRSTRCGPFHWLLSKVLSLAPFKDTLFSVYCRRAPRDPVMLGLLEGR